MAKKLTNEEFIDKCKKLTGDRFTYENTFYKGNKNKVILTCPVHGPFERIASSITVNTICRKCRTVEQGKIFINKALNLHGNKYDLREVNYTGSFDKVKVICNTHGAFYTTPNKMIQGAGCYKCGREKTENARRSNTKEFIDKAYIVHNNKYSYDKVNYEGSKDNVTIVCPKHGDFKQSPNSHLKGVGCPSCGQEKAAKVSRSRRVTTEGFIEESKKIHGNKYDYSKTKYINNHTPITIICDIHGEVSISPSRHKTGSGCRYCSYKKRGEANKTSIKDFKSKSNEVHNEKYDYSLITQFNTLHDKKEIICPKHGVFEQKLYSHMSGAGCEKCSYEERGENRTVTFEEFKDKSSKIHNNKYSYIEETFTRLSEQVAIICPHHGEFNQVASVHYYSGCPVCGEIISNLSYKGNISDEYINISKELNSNIYVIKFKDFYKIGISRGVKERVNLIKSRLGLNYKPKIIYSKEESLFDVLNLENYLHKKYKKYRFTHPGKFEGSTECFNLSLPIEEVKLDISKLIKS